MRRLAVPVGSVLLLAFAAVRAGGNEVTPVAAADLAPFLGHEHVLGARLSPNGKRLAILANEGGLGSVQIFDLQQQKRLAFFIPAGDTGVGDVHWANDELLAVEAVDRDGHLAAPRWRGEIFAVGADGKGARMIFGYRAGRMQAGSHIRRAESERAWGRVLARSRADRRKIVVQSEEWDEVGDKVASLYRVDVMNGLKDLIVNGPVAGAAFLADEGGEPRIACSVPEPGKVRCFSREAGQGWTELKAPGLAGTPIAFSSSAHTLYLTAPHGNGFGVFAVDLGSGERKLVAQNDLVPPSGWVLDSAHRLVAVEFTPDLPVYEVVLPEHPFARVLAGLEPSFPDEHIRIVSASEDDAKLVVEVFSDHDPGRFLVVDVASMTAEAVGERRPGVKPDEMAGVSAFHIAAGDGLRIHGYVTLPPPPAKPPFPMVVIPHGGPHEVRDWWGFDPEAQLLAHEGFAVLQVNYRGSGGYGDAYESAGFGHWGDRMIEDLADATRFAVKKRWADPGRICIYGASYGGYAALQATVVAPELFRCAAGYAGVYDLRNLLTGDLVTSRQARSFVRIWTGTDEEAIKRASPLFHADQVRVPVLLIHGKQDERAPIAGAEAMRKALIAQGRPPGWLVEDHEGHGFYDPKARERMARELVRFLRENTGPK